MATVSETITVTITGANAGTKNYTVLVDTATGNSTTPLSIPITGTAAGTSTVQASMPTHAGVPASNTAEIVWQAVNGAIATGPVTINVYGNNSSTRGWPGLNTGAGDNGRTFPYLNSAPTANSWCWNEVVQNYPINPFCAPNNVSSCGGGYKQDPMLVVQQTSGGTGAGSVSMGPGTTNNPDNGGNHPGFVINATGTLVVNTPGIYTFYFNFANVSNFGCWIGGGATFSSNNGPNSGGTPFPSTGPTTGYPLACANASTSNGSHPAINSVYVSFPKAGIYPIEVVYNQFFGIQFSGDNNGYFVLTYLSGSQNQSVGSQGPGTGLQFFPVALSTAPATGTTPTGELRLTPVGGAAGLVVQGQVDTLTLNVVGVPYTSINYIPILEGTAGSLHIYNGGTSFTFPTYNTHAVTPADAAAGVFSLSGDNSAWSGLFTVTASGTAFALNYTGGAFSFAVPGSHIASTSLTVTADDIAWYDFSASSNKFDLFTPSGSTGGSTFSADVDYMVRPTVSSVAPPSLQANGKSQPITITLSKPMSPQQQGLYGTGNTVVATASITGGATIGVLTPTLDGSGYLLGWTANVTVPVSSTNGSLTLSMSVTGTLTYLSGTAFVTNTVTYITGAVATIPTIGDTYVAPVAVSLATAPTSTSLGTTPVTITGTEYTFDNPSSCTMAFSYKFIVSGITVAITPSQTTPTASSTITVGGKTAYQKSYAVTHTFTTVSVATVSAAQVNLGFTVTDNTSGLATTYYSTTTYTLPFTIVGGGGGGGGCPAVEMFVDDQHQVFDVFEGMSLDTLAGEYSEYIGSQITTETRHVEWFDFSTEVCYRFITANGAEVIVSGSTPFPTRESIEALAAGVEAPYLASDIRAGAHAITDVGKGPEWSELVEVGCVGMRRVARLYCGGRNFAAGAKPGKYIFTHNVIIGK